MTQPSELLAVRHGQSEWNLRGRWQGQADPPLTDLGERQAEIAADALAATLAAADDGCGWRTPALRGGDLHISGHAFDLPAFDLIVSSDLQRARRTAEIIAKQLGVSDVVTDEQLRERKAGPWEGLTRAEIDEGWPGDVAARRWPTGFESEDSIARRLLPALRRHLSVCGRVLLVGHAGVLKTIDARVGLSDERVPNLAGRWFWLDGAAADASWDWDQLEPRNRVELVSSDTDLMIE
ncbi:histidine phosphatase family protein [Candidatus Poriferisodalis sp.]|uniref:histidine phosphatase family protein n=1 Tax=Candidatus Poriferisodalis sp. TaxID=3101277 RepID=UPI003B017C1C